MGSLRSVLLIKYAMKPFTSVGNMLKRKRTDSTGVANAGQKLAGPPENIGNPPGTWSNLASAGQTARLSKKQRKKLNKHLREQAEQRTIPPVEDILGWSVQYKNNADSYVPNVHYPTTYRDGTPPPPSYAPPPIPTSPPPAKPIVHTRNFAAPATPAKIGIKSQGSTPRQISNHPNHSTTYDGQPAAHSGPSKHIVQTSPTRWPHSSFVTNGKIIGSSTEEKAKGTFNLEEFDHYPPPMVERTLIVNPVPRKFRTREYFNSWCKDIGLPPPKTVLVGTKVTKALLEFASVEHARKAFNSPRLKNIDGRASIRVYKYYRSSTRQRSVSPPRPVMQAVPSTKHAQPIVVPPTTHDDMEEGEICEDEGSYIPPVLDKIQIDISQSPQQTVDDKVQQEDAEMDVDSSIEQCNATIETDVYVVPPSSTTNDIVQQSAVLTMEEEQRPSNTNDPITGTVNVESSPSPSELLASLRQRVLASKRRRTTAAAPQPEEKIDVAMEVSSNDQLSVSSASSISVVNSSSSFMSLTTTSSSDSSLAHEPPTPDTSTNDRSTHLEDLATDFLNSILDPIKNSSNPYSSRLDRKHILEEKQRRLERHIADSKRLMSNYTKAATKIEREQIMKSIRENNRCANDSVS